MNKSSFENCEKLTNINIPDGVTDIDDFAFAYCAKLTGIKLPDSVTSIGHYAFDGCARLKSIDIPDGVTNISEHAFSGCTSLTNINLPDGITSIGEHAFSGCTSLTNINIPNGITSIGSDVFEDCTNLTSINISENVTKISQSAFDGCVGLTTITVDKNNKRFTSVDGVLYNKGKSKLIIYPQCKKGEYTIPNGVKSIGSAALVACAGLTNVNIPESVTTIYSSAFAGCSGLTSITIPDSVTSIGCYAFAGCSGLTSITIPESVTKISSDVFGIFDGKTRLTTITVDKNNKSYTSVDGVLYDKSKSELLIYPKRKEGKYTIPNSVKSIGDHAFDCCTGLTSISIPDSVTKIGDWAFYGCTALTSITIPDSVTDIGEDVFGKCENLVIKTSKNSTAHEYAVKSHIKFDEFIRDCEVKNMISENIKTNKHVPFDEGLTKIESCLTISYKNDVIKQLVEKYNYKCSVCAYDLIDCYIEQGEDSLDYFTDNKCDEFPYYGVKTINDLTKTVISFLINNGTYDDGFKEAIIGKLDKIKVSYEKIDGNVVTCTDWKRTIYKGYIFEMKNKKYNCKSEVCNGGW